MSTEPANTLPPALWRSLDDLADTPEFRRMVENEFPSQLPQFLSPTSRRGFLKVMGASMALLGLTGCRWPTEEILPFSHRPEGVDPGVPRRFATVMEINGVGVPVVATSFDGRPVKVDGNPDHPATRGGSDVFVQASVLDLYDPDRSTHPMRRDEGTARSTTWEEFERFVADRIGALGRTGGRGLALLVEPTSSPTFHRLLGRFAETFPEALVFEHSPFPREVAGEPVARPDLGAAEVIVCFDDDLFSGPAGIRHQRDFARGRRGEDGRTTRLHAAECTFTITGGMADHRLPVRASRVRRIAESVLAAVYGREGPTGLSEAERAFADRAAQDLRAHQGRAVVTAGPGQPAALHQVVLALNQAIGAVGRTVFYGRPREPRPGLDVLARAIGDGVVQVLVVLGGNPVLTAPADLNFAELFARVPDTVHLSLHRDETSELATLSLNAAHWLEAWGDARSFDGRTSIRQPLIRPLYEGRSEIELLAHLATGRPRSGYDLVRETFGAAERGEGAWRKALHDGFFGEPDLGFEPPAPDAGVEPPPELTSEFEAVVRPDPKVGDGRFANNAWLQELPEPMTKVTWGNAALLSVADAARLGVKSGDHVSVRVGPAKVELPALVAPGQAKGAVTISAGYGRRKAGRVGDGVGADAYALRSAGAIRLAGWIAGEAIVEKAGGHTKIATTENHHAIESFANREVDERRAFLIREGTVAEHRENPSFAKEIAHTPELVQLFDHPLEYDGLKWGMSIDLSTCTGCSACVVACQAENNVPVVGPDEVRRGREMHWLRVDRYYAGTPDDPRIRHQPIPCMQCENAPCEQVCPVAATTHSREGLNDMTYNRCIGTRYCSNNCPYKVRRFNWFLNHKDKTSIEKMVFNPDVTVRNRGVMEKCTYCVQRISRARIAARAAGRTIRDGEVIPACAEACPAEAIVFGDLNDPTSRVAKAHADPRDYGLLEDLNTRPRTRYLAKLTNPVSEGEGR